MDHLIISRSHSRPVASFALLAILGLTSGCGTITRGTTQDIAIDSAPQGALVVASNGMGGTTPMSVKAARNTALTIKISKDGFKDHSAVITPHVSGGGAAGLAGNLVFGGIIGAAVDVGSGAMYDLTPEKVFAVLEKNEHSGDSYLSDEPAAIKSRQSDRANRYRTEGPERIIEYRTEYVVVSENDPRLKGSSVYHDSPKTTQYVQARRPEPKNIPIAFRGY